MKLLIYVKATVEYGRKWYCSGEILPTIHSDYSFPVWGLADFGMWVLFK